MLYIHVNRMITPSFNPLQLFFRGFVCKFDYVCFKCPIQHFDLQKLTNECIRSPFLPFLRVRSFCFLNFGEVILIDRRPVD